MNNSSPAQKERPRDRLGPATASPPFDNPQFHRGCRARVLCYHPEEKTYVRLRNVLFRDFAVTGRWDQLKAAYYPVPGLPPIRANAGEVQVCHILQQRQVADQDQADPSKVMLELTPRLAAVKVCTAQRIRELREQRHPEDPLKEIAVWQEISRHNPPHVATCIEVLFDPGNNSYNIVMPYYQQGDIHNYMFNRPGPKKALTEAEARVFLKQIIKGLRGLHDLKICHHDMKMENVMFQGNQAYIIDFGMAVKVPYQGDQRCLVKRMGAFGTFQYMAPEILADKDFDSEAIDVWSAGVMLFRMLTARPSYTTPLPTDLQFIRMTRMLDQLLATYGIDLSPECVDLLKGLLQVDPRLRLSIDEVLKHPWMQN